MTLKDRIEHIRQCLRRMKPTMGFELAAAEAIEKELVSLDEAFAAQGVAIEELRRDMNLLHEMIRNFQNGDTCG